MIKRSAAVTQEQRAGPEHRHDRFAETRRGAFGGIASSFLPLARAARAAPASSFLRRSASCGLQTKSYPAPPKMSRPHDTRDRCPVADKRHDRYTKQRTPVKT